MEGHNERHTPVTSDGKLSVVLENCDGKSSVALKKSFLNDHLRKVLSSRPLTQEQLADIWDEAPTRRAWWLDLHSSADIHAGTTISDLQEAVGRAEKHPAVMCCALCDAYVPTLEGWYEHGEGKCDGSIGQPAAAPVSFGHVTAANELTMPVCECSQPVASLRPFDWQCAKCKGVIPSPYVLTDEQRRDYLEAL